MTGLSKDNTMSRYLSFLDLKDHITQCFLFLHIIHDVHEACQQFSFLLCGKFLLSLLLAAFLHPGCCHPPSARFTPGAHWVGQEVACFWHTEASLYPRLKPGLQLPRRAPGQGASSSVAPVVGQGPVTHREVMSQGLIFLIKLHLFFRHIFLSTTYY